MKILEIGKYYYPVTGGMENHIRILSTELAKSNEVVVLVSNVNKTKRIGKIENVEIVRLPKYSSILNAPISPGMLFYPMNDFNVVHLHLPNPLASISVLFSKQKNLIVTYHSDILKSGISASFLNLLYTKMILERVLKKAKKIIVTSPNYIEDSYILKKFRKKTVVISFGIKRESFGVKNKEKLKKMKIKYHDRKIILFVGRLVPYKGLNYLIDAMEKVVSKTKNVVLIIVGDGPLKNEIKSQVISLRLNKHVKFVGELKMEELKYFYNICDIFVLPSIYKSEAFGIVQLEAMICGKPVISTNVKGSGMPFVNKHKETGLVVQPKNPVQLADSILYLLKNQNIRIRMGKKARERVKKHFPQEKMISDILKIYQGLNK